MAVVDDLRAENKRLQARIEMLTQDRDEARRVSREWERERHSFKAQAEANMARVREVERERNTYRDAAFLAARGMGTDVGRRFQEVMDEARDRTRRAEREAREADDTIKATLEETGALSLTALCAEFKGLSEHAKQLRIALQEASPHVSRQRIWGHTEIDRTDAKEWWEKYGNQKYAGGSPCGSGHG